MSLKNSISTSRGRSLYNNDADAPAIIVSSSQASPHIAIMSCYWRLILLAILMSTASCLLLNSRLTTITAQDSRYSRNRGRGPIGPLRDDCSHGIGRHPRNNRFIFNAATRTKHTVALEASPTIAEDICRTCVGIVLARRISARGLRNRSLSKSGARSAFVVAALSLATSWRNGITLLAFYWTSSKLTRFGSKIKGQLEEGVTEGGERGASQVFACSLFGVILACTRRAIVGRDGPLLVGSSVAISSSSSALLGDQLTLAYVAFFACCAGDTWASELGILSKSLPRLITKPWKKVPPGTNGGVSLEGLGASAAGGMIMGLIHGIFVAGGISSLLPFMPSYMASALPPSQYGREVMILTFVGFLSGFGGSLLDSLLGATVQATYYDEEAKKIVKRSGPHTTKVGGWGFLSNEMVNVVSTALSALAAALIVRHLPT